MSEPKQNLMPMQTSGKTQVSVIVACRNEIRDIHKFLESLSQQVLCGIGVEVLIADGMSDDGTRKVLEQHRIKNPSVRVIENPGKIVSTGLNAAIRQASGEIIVRMDAHTEYAPDYIFRCVEVLSETNAQNVGGAARTRADGYFGEAIAIAYGAKFACGGARFHDVQYEGYVDTLPYGCWRKSTLERLGMFDESLRRNQDDELNLRIVSTGGKVWQSPKIKSWYRPRNNLTALFHQYFQYGFWKVAVIRKHGRPASWRHLIPGACMSICFLFLAGAVGAGFYGSTHWEFALLDSLAVLFGIYSAFSIGAAFQAASRSGWRFLPFLPIVFATYHISYGLGFLLGLSYNPKEWNRPSPIRKVLTAITR
jgi:glycosyltransferase involved in cell wall biosynthesis